MHLVVPYAAPAAEAGVLPLQGLRLPQLSRLLQRLDAGSGIAAETAMLNLPHEHVLAAGRGWSAEDGRLPLAAAGAAADGLPAPAPGEGWGLLTPTHWQAGADQVLLLDPAHLHLDEDESRALLDALRGLFESEGWTLYWGAPLRWYARHPSLAELATASLDRVVGRPIEHWLPDRQAGRTLRRLQSEAQMLLYTHPINEARESRGELPVNSFWMSGTGRAVVPLLSADEPIVDLRLGAAWRAGDWPAWAAAWQALDAERLADLAARAERGDAVALTLCGDRAAQRFDAVAHGPWQRLLRRWRGAEPRAVLEAL
jgi:hypothetical protein